MTTATRTLADALEARWQASPKATPSEWPDARLDAADALRIAFVGEYWQYDDPPDREAESAIAEGWLEELRSAIHATVIEAFEAHVVPAAIATVKRHLPTAPDYLRIFPGSEQLRADLAALERDR